MYNTYYISHHGIEGQKWGVRNGPPYPLEGKKSHKTRHRLSDSQKTALKIGGIALAGALLTYGGWKLYKVAPSIMAMNREADERMKRILSMSIDELDASLAEDGLENIQELLRRQH